MSKSQAYHEAAARLLGDPPPEDPATELRAMGAADPVACCELGDALARSVADAADQLELRMGDSDPRLAMAELLWAEARESELPGRMIYEGGVGEWTRKLWSQGWWRQEAPARLREPAEDARGPQDGKLASWWRA